MCSKITTCFETTVSAEVHATRVKTKAIGAAISREEGVEIEVVQHIWAAHLAEIDTANASKLFMCQRELARRAQVTYVVVHITERSSNIGHVTTRVLLARHTGLRIRWLLLILRLTRLRRES